MKKVSQLPEANTLDGAEKLPVLQGGVLKQAVLNLMLESILAQETGDSTTRAMSQKAVTDALDEKLDKSSVVQYQGTSATDVMSQKAATDNFGQPILTGVATITGSNNKIVMTGIVSTLGLELGDVIQLNTPLNKKLHTVDQIINNNEIVVNYEHCSNRCNGFLKLVNESSISCTIKRFAKWYSAPLGLGQYPVNTTSVRTANVFSEKVVNREILVVLRFHGTPSAAGQEGLSLDTDDLVAISYRPTGGSSDASMTAIIPRGASWKAQSSAGRSSFNVSELR